MLTCSVDKRKVSASLIFLYWFTTTLGNSLTMNIISYPILPITLWHTLVAIEHHQKIHGLKINEYMHFVDFVWMHIVSCNRGKSIDYRLKILYTIRTFNISWNRFSGTRANNDVWKVYNWNFLYDAQTPSGKRYSLIWPSWSTWVAICPQFPLIIQLTVNCQSVLQIKS